MRLTVSLLLVLVCTALTARAEVPGKSPEQLRKVATHIVYGEVVAVYERHKIYGDADSEYGRTKEIKYVAEVLVKNVEKGEGLKAGDLVYVRYWSKEWLPPKANPDMPPPTGAGGHWNLPKEGAMLRIYLARHTHDGYDETKDGGFNVVGPNGFEKLPERR